MADAVAARREARKKRILENSHNRLQLISGKSTDGSYKDSTTTSPIPQNYETITDDIPSDSSVSSKYSLANGIINAESESFEVPSSRHDVIATNDQVANDLAAFGFGPITPAAPEHQSQNNNPIWRTALTYRYDIVLLSVAVQLVHLLFAFSLNSTYFFLPLIIYGATKFYWFPAQSNSSIANALLLLSGMSPIRLQRMLQILQWTGTISQDVCIFIFTTICIQSFFCLVRDSSVT